MHELLAKVEQDLKEPSQYQKILENIKVGVIKESVTRGLLSRFPPKRDVNKLGGSEAWWTDVDEDPRISHNIVLTHALPIVDWLYSGDYIPIYY